jgi:uncharacterized membrane protein YdbT with pleckstrin-like domain
MVGTWLLLGLISVVAIVAITAVAALRDPTIRRAILIGLVLLWLGALGVLVYRKLAHFYVLTNQRLKHRDGILIRQNNRVEVIDIDDVSFKQGIVETMLNVGTIRIRSSDTSHPELVLRGISNVKSVSDLIDNARRNERRKRGIYVESV